LYMLHAELAFRSGYASSYPHIVSHANPAFFAAMLRAIHAFSATPCTSATPMTQSSTPDTLTLCPQGALGLRYDYSALVTAHRRLPCALVAALCLLPLHLRIAPYASFLPSSRGGRCPRLCPSAPHLSCLRSALPRPYSPPKKRFLDPSTLRSTSLPSQAGCSSPRTRTRTRTRSPIRAAVPHTFLPPRPLPHGVSPPSSLALSPPSFIFTLRTSGDCRIIVPLSAARPTRRHRLALDATYLADDSDRPDVLPALMHTAAASLQVLSVHLVRVRLSTPI
jgi:hypothetical protein